MPSPAQPVDAAVAAALAELDSRGDVLTVGGLSVAELARRFGTPLYVFAADVLRARVGRVRAALGPRVELLYSLKANPNVAVAAVLRAAGAGVEVASAGEVAVAEAAGFAAAGMRFAGPGKTAAELAFALQRGVGCVHLESADEAAQLSALAAAAGVRPRVALRVHLHAAAGARMRMAGASSRFGVDEAQVPELLARLHRDPHLELCGLHAYAGTQNFDAAAFAAGAAALLTAADAWERQLSLRLCEIDFGGGFGIAVYAGDPVFDLDAAGARLRAVLPGHERGERRFLVELGRFLTAPAGVYIAAVQHSKSSGGVRHAVLDGGLHHCAAAAGVGTVLRRPPLLVRADAATGNDGVDHVVGGPLCTPMDQFAEAFRCRELRVGDLVAVLHAGAYGLTYSPTAFLGHPTAAEVLVDGGQARLVRERGTFADALRGQRW